MAMDNELRKILLREQDLRFVTDTLGQYLGKKAEERNREEKWLNLHMKML